MKYIIEESLRDMVCRDEEDFYSHYALGLFLFNVGRLGESGNELRKALDLLDREAGGNTRDIEGNIKKLLGRRKRDFSEAVSGGTKEYQVNVILSLLDEIKLNNPEETRLLDIGSGKGGKVYAIAKHLKIPAENVTGVDYDDFNIDYVRKFFNVVKVDLEKENLPFKDGEFDLIICNQVYEHLKNIGSLTGEVYRTLKRDGFFLIGTPNLSSFYNRMHVLLGRQPSCMKIKSTHVRGFTPRGIRRYLEENNFRVAGFRANGLYPLPIEIGRHLAEIFPSFGEFIYFLVQKTED